MKIVVLGYNLEKLTDVDNVISFVLVERYNETSGFELIIPISSNYLSYILSGRYIMSDVSDKVFMIENVTLKYSADTQEQTVVISGDSAEKILTQRVTRALLTIDGGVQTTIEGLIVDHFIKADNEARIISNFGMVLSTDQNVVSLTLSEQYDVGTVYSIIENICKACDLGFKVELIDSEWTFSLYAGVNRSWSQTENSFVIFGKGYDNLNSGEQYISDADQKNVNVVLTDDSVPAFQEVEVYYDTEPIGIDRREMVTVATDITREVDGGPLTDEELLAIIESRGYYGLYENSLVVLFDGKANIDRPFTYKTDFFMGDIVQVILNGQAIPARLVEVNYSLSTSGMLVYGTFDFNQ